MAGGCGVWFFYPENLRSKARYTPPMLRSVGLITLLIALHGCATQEYCSEHQFFKPKVIDGKSIQNRYFPHVAEFEFNEEVNVRLAICKNLDALCVEIFPTKDVSFQFLETKVKVFTKLLDKMQVVNFKQITYNVVCRGSTLSDEDARCRSTNETPLVGDGTIEKRLSRAEKIGSEFFYINTYGFSPDTVFKGADVSVAFRTFRRKYEVMTDVFDLPLNHEVLVELPRMQVGSRILNVPQVSFRFSKETVCLPNRPLSLQ